MSQNKYDGVRNVLGNTSANALAELHSLYDARTYEWAASTYDPDMGAFYATHLALQTEGYLPNIESTCHALRLVKNTGMANDFGQSVAAALPDTVGRRIVEFVKSMQDPDGYFYLPQWGKEVMPSRIARDLAWAQFILGEYGERPNYPYATERIATGDRSGIPAYFGSAKLLREYLESLDINKNSYVHGQQIASQTPVAIAAGLGDVVYDYLCERQNPDTGLWEDSVNITSISGLLKLGTAFNVLKKPIPNWEMTLESAIEYAASDHSHPAATAPYNAVNGIGRVIENLKRVGANDQRNSAVLRARKSARGIILATVRRVSMFKRDDGGFSYFADRSAPRTEGCPVAPGVCESDLNGTLLSLNSDTGLYEIFDIDRVPIWDAGDLCRFREFLLSAPRVIKKHPRPSDDVMTIFKTQKA